ncbi:sugar transferase, partial [Staphylococcus aureus]|uniref:sugar transferase n=1 Tax=Staphylococcus aureus TaxID=1280 RepID=UPI001E64F0E8
VRYRLPAYKRAFDIIASGSALILLSPLFLVVGACIALESKGPIIYKSKRVGTGYKIFDFYKFRSMRVNADKEINLLSSLNQYT